MSRRRFRWRGAWRPHWPRTRSARRRASALLGASLLLLVWLLHAGPVRQTWERRAILDAIRHVESSGRDDVPDGDDGLAIGPYQIHEVYWRDAFAFDPSLGGDYQACRQRRYAERVIDAFMRRHAPAAWAQGDAETIARIHNGGPLGAQKPSTLGYWQRVRSRLP